MAEGAEYSLTVLDGPEKDKVLTSSHRFTGTGEAKYPNGDVYKGGFKDGKRHGLGRMTYARGGYYHGFYEQDKRGAVSEDSGMNREGTMKYPNNDVYSGLWLNDKKHGVGTYVFNTTKYKFIGDWVQGEMAKGRWVMSNGNYFA